MKGSFFFSFTIQSPLQIHKYFVDCAEFFHKSIESYTHTNTYAHQHIHKLTQTDARNKKNRNLNISVWLNKCVVKSNENEKSSFDQKKLHTQTNTTHIVYILPLRTHARIQTG